MRVFGFPGRAIRVTRLGVVPAMLTTTTSRSRIEETYAVVVPLTATVNGVSPPATPGVTEVLYGRRSYSNRFVLVAVSMTVIKSL